MLTKYITIPLQKIYRTIKEAYYSVHKFGLEVNAKEVTSEGYNQSAMREENKRFVLNSSGGMDWGYVSENLTADDGTKIKAAPIRLQVGFQVGTNTAGAGYVHLLKHSTIATMGGVESAINEILSKATIIVSSGVRLRIIEKTEDTGVMMVLELQHDTSTGEDYYSIITITPQAKGQIKSANKKALTFGGRQIPLAVSGNSVISPVSAFKARPATVLVPNKVSAFNTVSLSDVDEYVKKFTYEGYNQPQNVSFYEVQAIKKRSAVAFTANERLATYASNISIRDALADVKDGEGISYINSDGSGNFKLYNQSAAMKLSEFATYDEFADAMDKIKIGTKENSLSKKGFNFVSGKGSIITLSGSTYKHLYKDHPELTKEDIKEILYNVDNARYAVKEDAVGFNTGIIIKSKIKTPTGYAGVVLEFMGNGKVMPVTMFKDSEANIDNWALKKKQSQTLELDANGNPERILGNASFVEIVQQKLGIVNKQKWALNQNYKQMVGAEQLHQDIQAWGELVDSYKNSDKAAWKKKNDGALYDFMKVPLVMQLVGVDYNDIKIYGSFFEHSVRAKHSGMTLDIVKQLPQAMVDPIMIVKGNKPNSYVFVLEVVDNNGATVVVPVEITKQDRLYGVINVANSAFGRDKGKVNKIPAYNWFINSMKNDEVLYINNKKSTSWVQSITNFANNGSRVGTELNSAFLELIISNTDGHVKTDADLDRLKMQYLELYQNIQGIQGQIAIAENGKRIISLFKSADESTFVHEMSHMALADLKELAALENVAEQVKKDWATVKEWASFEAGKSELYKDTPWEKEFRKLEEEINACEQSGDTAEANRLKDVFLQERFARGFESYLKSGKAPTSALRSVFRQFKKWLTKIYRDFIGTGAMPSEAVREVMDRLVATQENIEQEGRLAELHSLRKNKVFNEVDKSTAVMYERWQKEAREEAEERVLSKALREAGSTLLKEQKEALKQFRDEERARLIKENKVFTAEEFLKRAGGDMSVLPVLHYTAESYAKELKKAGGSLEEVLAKAVEQKKQELGEVTEEKIAARAKEAFQTSEYRNRVLGLELEALKRKKELADKSNTKIIKKLEELKVINEKIEKSNTAEEKEVVEGEKRAKLADLRFSKDWSPKEERLLKNGEVEALKNIISSRQEHLKVLRDEAVKNVEVYKALAEKELARLPISEATATRLWINKEKRAGQRVQTALVAGKWEEAMLAKKEQLMYSTLAWKSVELKEKVLAKTRVLANKAKVIAKPKSKMPVSERYLFQHALYVFGITRSDVPIPLGGKESLISMLSRYNDEFEHGFTTNEDNGGVPLWLLNALDDSKIYAKGKTEGYQALNIGQFEDLTNILTMIYTVGRESGNLRTVQDDAGNVVDVKEAVENIVANIQQNIIAPINHDRTGLTLQDYMAKAIKYVGDEVRGYIKAETIFDQIDGGQENGFAMRYLYNPIQKARNAEMVEHEKLSKEFQGLVKAHYDSAAWSKMFSDKVYELGTSQLTKEQVISIALNCGTTINTKRILDGYGVTWRQIEKLLSNLNGDDWGFVTGVWKMMGSYWEDTVKLEERLTGVTLEKQEAVPFTIKSKDGDIYRISGGYYPIVYDTTKSIRAANNKNDDMARTGMSGNAILETNLGFIKSRVTGKVNMPILLGFDIIGRALDSVVHNLCFREAVRDTNKLLNDRNITGALREYYGEETGNKLVRNLQQWARDNWVEDVKTGWYDKSIKFMRNNTTMAIMGYRVTTAVLNVLNIANIEEHIGAGRAALAVKEYYSEPLKNWKFVTSKSVFLRQRATTMDRDIREVLAKTKYSGNQVTDFIKREQFSVIAMTDNMLAQPLWLTEYKRVYREGIGKKLAPEVVERMAIDAGDQAVRRVFGSGDIKDLAPAQKGSEVTKMLTMFWSYANTVFNALVRSYNTGDRYRFIRSLLYLCLKTSIGEAFIRAALAGGDDDEPWYEKAVKRIPSTLWSQIFGFSPVLRILGEPAGKVVFDEKGYNNKTTAAFGTYDRWDVVMGTIKSMDGEKSKKDWLDLAQEAVKFTNSVTGLSDTITDGVFTTMRYWDNDFDNDFTEYLRAVMLDKHLKKSKKSV